jgi:hypothetical protein
MRPDKGLQPTAIRLQARLTRLAVLLRTAFHRLDVPCAVVIIGSLEFAQGPVWHWSCGPVTAFYRNSQRPGQCPITCSQTGSTRGPIRIGTTIPGSTTHDVSPQGRQGPKHRSNPNEARIYRSRWFVKGRSIAGANSGVVLPVIIGWNHPQRLKYLSVERNRHE